MVMADGIFHPPRRIARNMTKPLPFTFVAKAWSLNITRVSFSINCFHIFYEEWCRKGAFIPHFNSIAFCPR